MTTAREALLALADELDEIWRSVNSEALATGFKGGAGMAREHAERYAAESPWPLVKGRCPACGLASLFLGEGGYVTCSVLECREPDAAATLLERDVRDGAS